MTDGFPDISQIMKIIPGMIVTVIGGVVTSILPGKVKIAGLPIVGYGLYMTLKSLGPSTKLIVTVADTQGNPIPQALVNISGPVTQQKYTECYPWPGCSVTSAIFEGIPAGEYQVDVSHPEFESMTGYITVIENQDNTITFILRAVPTEPVEIVHIASEDDRVPAQMVANAFGISIVNDRGGIPLGTDVTTVGDEELMIAAGNILYNLRDYSIIASIGGQFANPLFEAAARTRPADVKRLTGPGDWSIQRTTMSNIQIVFIAGWNPEDTIAAVNEFLGQTQEVGAEINHLHVNSI